ERHRYSSSQHILHLLKGFAYFQEVLDRHQRLKLFFWSSYICYPIRFGSVQTSVFVFGDCITVIVPLCARIIPSAIGYQKPPPDNKSQLSASIISPTNGVTDIVILSASDFREIVITF